MEMPVIEDLDGQQCADVLVSSVAVERAAAARSVRAMAQWAVLHDADTIHPPCDGSGRVLPGTERARRVGGDGTPLVAEFAVHELAMLLGLPFLTCRNTLADVLDLVHRHPRLWARLEETARCDKAGVDPAVAVGLPQAWQALQVAPRLPPCRPLVRGGPLGGCAHRDGSRGAALGPVPDQADRPDPGCRPGAGRGMPPVR